MLEKLKSELEEIAFMLGENTNRKETHSKVIQCLLLVENLRGISNTVSSEIGDVEEINKVSRRLRLWAKSEKQCQYNSQILNAYLALFNSGCERITEHQLSAKLGNPNWFSSNYVQMKVKADKNHGKIFDTSSGYIMLWKPVEHAVYEYEQQVISRMNIG